MSMSPSYFVTDSRVGYPSFCFLRQSLYIIMDETKEQCITQIDNYYCRRLTELVDSKMYDEAHSIFEEFSLGDEESYQWCFLKILEDTTNE